MPIRTFFALVALAGATGIAGSAEPPANPPANPASHELDEVVVSAQKYDRRTLEHVIIPRFVQSHGEPTPTIGQVGRWRQPVCPQTTGLQPAFAEFVTRRIVTAAQSVGAPSKGIDAKCAVNIEIVFTPTPQELLNHIAGKYPALLGSVRTKNDTKFTRAIQTWFLTGTKSMAGWTPPVGGLDTPPSPGGDNAISASEPLHSDPGMQVDAPNGQGSSPGGLAGSRLGSSLRSEFLHALVIVDSHKVEGLPIAAVADYVAMVALTRVSALDTCSELPSIIDLLSSTCGDRPHPDSITVADTAFLKALYRSDLEMKLNIEQGEMHDRMLAVLEQR